MSSCRCICHRGMLWHPINEFCCPETVHIEKPKPGPGEHQPYIESVSRGFRAMCACGWRTEYGDIRQEAELALDSHKLKTRPKTALSIWDRT